MYTVIEGGVTAAAGFETASTAAGIKYKNRKDMASTPALQMHVPALRAWATAQRLHRRLPRH